VVGSGVVVRPSK